MNHFLPYFRPPLEANLTASLKVQECVTGFDSSGRVFQAVPENKMRPGDRAHCYVSSSLVSNMVSAVASGSTFSFLPF